MPRPKNTDIGKTYSYGGKTYIYNGHLHEKIDYKTWLKTLKEAEAHNMSKAAYVRHKLGTPLSPNTFSHENIRRNNES